VLSLHFAFYFIPLSSNSLPIFLNSIYLFSLINVIVIKKVFNDISIGSIKYPSLNELFDVESVECE